MSRLLPWTLLALVLGGTVPGIADEGGGPPPRAPTLAVGSPREGPLASLAGTLTRRGRGPREVDALPGSLSPVTEAVILARPPRSPGEAAMWETLLRRFLAAGGRVAAGPGAEEVLARAAPAGAVLGRAVAVREEADVEPAADLLHPPRFALRHPADGTDPGVAPALFRLRSPVGGTPLPWRTVAFLAAVAAAFAATLATLRRRGAGSGRTLLVAGAVSLAGSGLFLLPGVAPDPVRVERWVVEERAEFDAPWARRTEVLRVTARRPGVAEASVEVPPGGSWEALRFEAAADAVVVVPSENGVLRIPFGEGGRVAMAAGVTGVEAAPAPGPDLVRVLLRGDRAWRLAADASTPSPGDPGESRRAALSTLRRDPDPRLAAAGDLLMDLLRTTARGEGVVVRVPAAGPVLVLEHGR